MSNSDLAVFDAIYRDDALLLGRLLAGGADPDACCGDEGSWDYRLALHTAAAGGQARCVRMLLAHGADPNAHAGCAGWGRALHAAAYAGSTPCVFALLSRGASWEAIDGDGATPLHAAATGGSPMCCRILIGFGASVHARDWNGATPLHRASTRCAAEALLAAGASIRSRTTAMWLPMHSAIEAGCMDAAEHLAAIHIQAAWRTYRQRARAARRIQGVPGTALA